MRSFPGPFGLGTLMLSLLLTSGVALTHAQNDLQTQLKARFEGNIVTVRGFPVGNRLRYDADGTLMGSAEAGIWTLDGRIRIDRVRVQRTSLRIDGSRVAVSYDPEARTFTYAVMRDRRVRLDVAVGAAGGEAQIGAALARVFLSSADDLADLVPEHWRPFLREYRNPDWPPKVPNRDDSRMTMPQLLREVKPAYPQLARDYRQEGVVVLETTVTTEGRVEAPYIIRAHGFGLDEAAIDAARKWEFEPALVDGTPTPIVVRIQMSFTLRR